MVRRVHSPHTLTPPTHLLSNGRYAVMITGAGSGYSRWRGLAITRWREDVTCDPWGAYVFLRDLGSGAVWSAGYQPTGVEPDRYEVRFAEDRVEIERRDGTITTVMEIVVSPEDDAEARRVSVTNHGSQAREIELTSYAEIVLAPPAADTAHPAFSKLFVRTELVAERGALLAMGRPRSPGEAVAWASHLAVVEGNAIGGLQLETDRARFIGRGQELRTAAAPRDARPLSGTVGTVLDPIFSLRRRVRVPPGATARVTFWTLVAPSRSEVLELVNAHHVPAAFERAAALARAQAQAQLRQLAIGPDEAERFQRLASLVLHSDAALRPAPEVLGRSESGPATLWAHAISGDLPIVLLRIDDAKDLGIVRELLCAHAFWRRKLLAVDLVILDEAPAVRAPELEVALEAVTTVAPPPASPEQEVVAGGVFVLRGAPLSDEVRDLLSCVARVVLDARDGSLARQLGRVAESELVHPPPRRHLAPDAASTPPPARTELEFYNGLGGFGADGREYVTHLGDGQWTPVPWINVVANPSFGFQASAAGSGFTWSINSRENQITPWSNDPVGDRPGEVIFVRDLDSGALWCPTALPIREDPGPYVARHGHGYSRFERSAHEIGLELLQYVPPADPVKISRLTLHNRSDRIRRVSVTAYVEWTLASSRAAAAPYIVTEIDPGTGALLARNPFRVEFGGRVAFADLAGRQTSFTADRREFIGRNGALDHPAALASGEPLSRRVGPGLDPCGALQTLVEIRPNARVEVVFLLGEAATKAEARSLVERYRSADLDGVLRAVTQQWEAVLGAVQVRTPDRGLDLLLNRWLLYQTLACRVWARSGFYQLSGAYGYRDQLQDVMALALSRPEIAREHLLRAAGRQFLEGDVQHWWLPGSGRGIRTRFADDRIWLPYVAAHYVAVTQDAGVLDEPVGFLEGAVLRPGEHESFFQPEASAACASVFEHCARALDESLSRGSHGLPLMGTGDWNDGMNRVGAGGTGESVWLAWFLYTALLAFAPLAERRGEQGRAAAWRQHAAGLRAAVEREAWDGSWYRRGYYDDGTPLGSASSAECRIDSIAQSWGVLSGAADPQRAAAAMASVETHLVRREDGLVLLFTPPFDRTPLDPGYVKGYPPGIRENGGQYTHAALWSVIAFALLGDGDKAGELLSILNPIHHARTPAAAERYKVEPYVVCADLYSEPPHVGRGGWTWYTGSAGWMYRTGLEWILGFRPEGASLLLDPCIPKAWPGFEIVFRHRSARYEIAVENPRGVSRGVSRLELDGVVVSGEEARIPLADDGATHRVRVRLG